MTPLPALELVSLMNRYERPLVRYAQSIVGELDGARDVVQETFIKYARGSAEGAPALVVEDASRHVESWLFTVTRNGALDHLRKHSRIIPMPLPDDRRSEGASPDEEMVNRESAEWLLRLP